LLTSRGLTTVVFLDIKRIYEQLTWGEIWVRRYSLPSFLGGGTKNLEQWRQKTILIEIKDLVNPAIL